MGDGRLRGAGDGRPARIPEAQQPADLVERLARGVVDGRPEQPVVEVVPHLDEERVAAGHDQGDQRERRAPPSASPGSSSQPAYTWPSRWLTGTSGLPWAQASVFAKLMPTSSDPASPGP